MTTILDKIVATKKKEIAAAKSARSADEWRDSFEEMLRDIANDVYTDINESGSI